MFFWDIPLHLLISTNLNYRTGDINIFNSTGLSDRLRIGDSYAYSAFKVPLAIPL